jgi:hypothetical protein
MENRINLRTLSDTDIINLHKEKLAKYKSERQQIVELENRLSTQMPNLQAGDIKDINKIIWPFYFTTPYLQINPESTESRFISITQEAAFVWTHQVRTVFKKVSIGGGDFEWNYINPAEDDGIVEGLEFSVTDAQSSRTFHHNPISINHAGYAQEPEKLETPMMIAPNNNLEIKFYNNSSNIYIPFITFYGYRVRLEDSQDILSYVHR